MPLTPPDTAWNTGHHAVTNAWEDPYDVISLHLEFYEFSLAFKKTFSVSKLSKFLGHHVGSDKRFVPVL